MEHSYEHSIRSITMVDSNVRRNISTYTCSSYVVANELGNELANELANEYTFQFANGFANELAIVLLIERSEMYLRVSSQN
jgi:hypothetical protein